MKSFFVQFGLCVTIVTALFACLPTEAEAGGGLAFVQPQRTVRRFSFNPLTLTFRQSIRQDAPALVQRQIVQPFVLRQQFVQPFVQQQLVVPYVQQQQLIVPHCQSSAAFFLR